MENLLYQTTSVNKLINIFFRVLLAFFFGIVAMLFFLKINDTVGFKEGVVQSTNPQMRINAVQRGQVLKVYVKEGQEVNVGDTLYTLDNKDIVSEYKMNDNDIKPLQQKLIVTKSLLDQAKARKMELENGANTGLSGGSIDEVNAQIYRFSQDCIDYTYQIEKKKGLLENLLNENKSFVVTSPGNGTVSYVFNSKQNISQVNEGDLLAIVSPRNEDFYARVALSENDLAYIQKGQRVIMKLNAYYYYKYGSINGMVDYISPSDVNNKFFALVKLDKYNSNIKLKAGYALKGEIVIEELKIYQYLAKKLLNKV